VKDSSKEFRSTLATWTRPVIIISASTCRDSHQVLGGRVAYPYDHDLEGFLNIVEG
jgi:hypothetical protein